jgi:hypothetical protein
VLKKLLLSTNNKGKTTWHLTTTSGNSETLQNVRWCAKEKLTKEENKKMLLAQVFCEGPHGIWRQFRALQ